MKGCLGVVGNMYLIGIEENCKTQKKKKKKLRRKQTNNVLRWLAPFVHIQLAAFNVDLLLVLFFFFLLSHKIMVTVFSHDLLLFSEWFLLYLVSSY